MKTRGRTLPAGWYPTGEVETIRQFKEWEKEYNLRQNAVSVIVPHAGWFFSGKLAFGAISSLRRDCSTVVVVGGHMAPGGGILAAPEEGYETPLGVLPADKLLLEKLQGELDIMEDNFADNTVEIQLPILAYCMKGKRALYMRVSPSEDAVKLGEKLAELNKEDEMDLTVIGSTDLTHYGPSYGFTPKGVGSKARQWVEEVNDKKIIDAMVEMDGEQILKTGNEEKAACSAGAAAAASTFAKELGVNRGTLLDYYTSASIHPGDSMVGYAGIIYRL